MNKRLFRYSSEGIHQNHTTSIKMFKTNTISEVKPRRPLVIFPKNVCLFNVEALQRTNQPNRRNIKNQPKLTVILNVDERQTRRPQQRQLTN